MIKELIKTEHYLLVVDESEIKTWYYDEYSKKVHHSGGAEYSRNDITKNIVAHLPLNGYGILEGVPLLPPLEDDNNKDLFYQKQVMNPYPTGGQSYASYEKGFVEGYNKAKEKYKFTEEDIRDVIMVSFLLGVDRREYSKEFEDEIIKKFSQAKTYTHFEFKMRDALISPMGREVDPMNFDQNQSSCIWQKVIKTTTNSQGQQVACGKYIY